MNNNKNILKIGAVSLAGALSLGALVIVPSGFDSAHAADYSQYKPQSKNYMWKGWSLNATPKHYEDSIKSVEDVHLNNFDAVLFKRMNEERVKRGMKPLKTTVELDDLADARAREIQKDFSHAGFGGRTPGPSRKSGENIFAYPTLFTFINYSEALNWDFQWYYDQPFDAYRNSAGHWAQMIDPEYTHVGISTYYNANGDLTNVMNFAKYEGDLSKVPDVTETDLPKVINVKEWMKKKSPVSDPLVDYLKKKEKEDKKNTPKPKPEPKPTEKSAEPETPKPEPKPTEKPAEPETPKPTEKPKPVETPKPEPKPTEKPKPVETPKPEPEPTEKPQPESEKPVENPKPETPKPDSETTEKPVETPKSTETPKPEPKPTEKPAEPETPKPTENPVEPETPKPDPEPTENPEPENPAEDPEPEKPTEEFTVDGNGVKVYPNEKASSSAFASAFSADLKRDRFVVDDSGSTRDMEELDNRYGKDLDMSNPNASRILRAYESGIVRGFVRSNGVNFEPNADVTRMDAAVMLYRMYKAPNVERPEKSPFTDVDSDHAFYDAALWTNKENLITADDQGAYRPEGSIERGEMTEILYKAEGTPNIDAGSVDRYSDVKEGDSYAKSSDWFRSRGSIKAWRNSDNLSPHKNVTRGEFISSLFVGNAIDNLKNSK